MSVAETIVHHDVLFVGTFGGVSTVLCNNPCSGRGQNDGEGIAEFRMHKGEEIGVKNIFGIGKGKQYPVCYVGGCPRGICNWHR